MAKRKPKLTERERENIARCKKVRREAKARADAIGRLADSRFASREAAYLKAHPHLAKHKHCGLAPDTVDHPRKRVVMPNGFVLYSSWYKVPTTDADSRRAYREQQYLWTNQPRIAA